MGSSSTPRPLPGRQPLPREFVTRHQRRRIVSALVEEIAGKGYGAVTVADVVRRAEVARKTFYENFDSKEDCFLTAQRLAMAEALERVVDAAGELDKWADRVEAGLTAFLRYVVEEPALARTGVVEALTAGPEAVRCYEESLQAFVSLFRQGRKASPRGEQLPETMDEAIVGGVFWIVHQRLVLGQTEGIEGLLPELVEFALTPYLGAEAARRPGRQIDRKGEAD